MRRSLCIAVVAAFPSLLSAQSRERCDLVEKESTRLTHVATPGGQGNRFVGGGVDIRCPSKEVMLKADSLESYGDDGRLLLFGNVRYNEPRLSLTSNFLTYDQRDERVFAHGNVNTTLPNGSTLRGPAAEYFRAVPGVRTVARINATSRPTVTIAPRDTTGRDTVPTIVVANTILMLGDSLVYAGGNVEVTRDDVMARGDSMALDSERELTVLLRGPSIESRGERPYTLRGQRIELHGRDKALRSVMSMGFANATSQDMVLASDTIHLMVENDLLQRAVAWGPSRARAASAQQNLVADSIDVRLPNQRIRELYAVRGAAADGRPDTTRFRADTVDWLRGDTVIARFDTTLARDSASRARLRELEAHGSAKSFHHMAPADSSMREPAINYVTGREIRVFFDAGKPSKVTVIEKASGVYLEPKRPAARPATDTTRAAPPPARPRP
jgi:lipopolysaccharide export system protein LptA